MQARACDTQVTTRQHVIHTQVAGGVAAFIVKICGIYARITAMLHIAPRIRLTSTVPFDGALPWVAQRWVRKHAQKGIKSPLAIACSVLIKRAHHHEWRVLGIVQLRPHQGQFIGIAPPITVLCAIKNRWGCGQKNDRDSHDPSLPMRLIDKALDGKGVCAWERRP